MQTVYDGDVTSWSIPQAYSDLTGTLPSNALPGGTPTGTGVVVMQTSPALVTPALGTPASGTLTNCTFPTLNQNTTGTSGGLTGTPAITVGAITSASETCSGTVQGATVTSTGGLNAGTTKFAINSSGICTEYDAIACTGQGLPALVGVVTTGTHTAAITATNLLAAPVAGGFYRISAYMKITVATTTPVAGPITITYKDSDGVSQSVVMMLQNAAGAVATSTGSTTTTPVMGALEIYCGSGTAINYAVGFSGTGTYELVLKCESF